MCKVIIKNPKNNRKSVLRTEDTYYEKISIKAIGTQLGIKQSINSFFSYCMEKGIGDPLIYMKKSEENCFDLLQSWINWKSRNGIAASTIRHNFSSVKGFLYYMGIKISEMDVKTNIMFPQQLKEELHPLQLEEIRKILEFCNGKKKSWYLCLLSSGIRMGEGVQLRKKDFDLSQKRIKIKIPARITKTKSGRTTFISKEAASFLIPKLKSLKDDELVFGSSEIVQNARMNEEMILQRVLKKAGLDNRYDGKNKRKISHHSFRAYFFTKAARCHDENYAHKMTGHGGYLVQYDRLTDEEKLDLYLQLEPDLLIFDTTRAEARIKTLEKAQEENEKLKEKTQILEDRIARLEQILTNKNSTVNRI